MTVKIESLGVVVPGAVVRKHDGTDTTLTLTAEQARSLYESLGTVIQFFSMHEPAVGSTTPDGDGDTQG